MANGLKALRHVGGGVQRYSEYTIASGQAGNIFNGDLVVVTAGNVIAPADDAASTGSFVGVMYVNPQGEQKFSPMWPDGQVGTEIKALVNEDKNVSYKVECLTGALAAGDDAKVANQANGVVLIGQSGETAVSGTGTQLTVLRVLEVGAVNDQVEVTVV